MRVAKYLIGSAVIVSFVLASSQINIQVQARGLSGQKGNVRGWPAGGVCKKLYKRYIAASGHSAYSHTTGQYFHAAVCGVSLNQRSVGSAEAGALKTCKRGLKRYKNGSSGNCIIYFSK